eukprot:CAMPEP_0172731666 /NCGR_PEP_ID=MMETSP1074-20121228/102036_1 /TAXON_ID=2916 /ORGANISM="Ceratium fusus, Strain PA161109" /LENGTH=77 /DNA_ID=CAMNT_0013559741 /DNA_START=295 /DNA_END=528 /DNA_ORIENTATION=+
MAYHCLRGQIKGQVGAKATLQEIVEHGKLGKTLANLIVFTVAADTHNKNSMLPSTEQRDTRPEKAHALLQDATIIRL